MTAISRCTDIIWNDKHVNFDTFFIYFFIILMFLHVHDQVSHNFFKLTPTPTTPHKESFW